MKLHNTAPAAIGVVGATGYTGLEVLRVLGRHEGVRVAFATSEREAGEASAVPGLPLARSEDVDPSDVEIVFLCLPHGEAVPWAERALSAGARVVDLTSDHRPGSGREEAAVYGMADLVGTEIRDAHLVANPGCYPTGVTLALQPLVTGGLIEEGRPVVIDAASGVTGAGRTPRRDLLFAEVSGDYRAYGLGNDHRHLKEMRASFPQTPLLFQPHLLPVPRGILETIYLPVHSGVDAAAVKDAWLHAFKGAGTIRIREGGAPALSDVVGTDLVTLGAVDNVGVENVVTVVAALDNLGKGAAGQAVQNMNLMLGLEPERGLRC